MAVSHLLLHVSDLQRAERFYTEELGFHIARRDRLKDGRPLTVLEEGMGLTPYPEGMAPPACPNVEHIAFRVASIEPLVERFAASGRSYEGPVVTERYGRSLYVRDEDGNRIELHDR
jgi:catechol 2,3-dioxygenase-like lactoylglutathione lyase family enzyme